jgi:Ca2+:H+ antiporter
MVNKLFIILVVMGIPISVIGSVLHWSDVVMFIVYCLTIITLAGFIGRATESLAIVMNGTSNWRITQCNIRKRCRTY